MVRQFLVCDQDFFLLHASEWCWPLHYPPGRLIDPNDGSFLAVDGKSGLHLNINTCCINMQLRDLVPWALVIF